LLAGGAAPPRHGHSHAGQERVGLGAGRELAADRRVGRVDPDETKDRKASGTADLGGCRHGEAKDRKSDAWRHETLQHPRQVAARRGDSFTDSVPLSVRRACARASCEMGCFDSLSFG
jgi:hypothetical protein